MVCQFTDLIDILPLHRLCRIGRQDKRRGDETRQEKKRKEETRQDKQRGDKTSKEETRHDMTKKDTTCRLTNFTVTTKVSVSVSSTCVSDI